MTFARQKSPVFVKKNHQKPTATFGPHRKTLADLVKPWVQAKFVIGQQGDEYEEEADRIADTVTRESTPNSALGKSPTHTGSSFLLKHLYPPEPELQRQPTNEKDEDEEKSEDEKQEPLQTKAQSCQPPAISPSLGDRINSLLGGGRPLPQSEREYFEPRFGYNFSEVRIHADGESAVVARGLNARAFTVGNDIAFGAGQYAPKSTEGQRLMAHELTHVAQQNNLASHSTENIKSKKFSLLKGHSISKTPIIQRASTNIGGVTYYSTRPEAEAVVPTHVSPRACFVWQDGPSDFPWRPIPGTGCAHWVAHEKGLNDTPGCFSGNAIRVSQVISGLTNHSLQNAAIGDIWTNSAESHTGIVQSLNTSSAGITTSVNVEHDSSGQGGVVTSEFTSGNFYR
jgi:hypothetical protein